MAQPIKVTKGGVVVPEWGNDGRADDEKIKVHYHFLSFAEQQDLLDPADVGKSFAYESRVLAAMIDKIENLEIDDGKVRAIKTGEDLVKSNLDKLAMELWITFRNMSAVDKKK